MKEYNRDDLTVCQNAFISGMEAARDLVRLLPRGIDSELGIEDEILTEAILTIVYDVGNYTLKNFDDFLERKINETITLFGKKNEEA